MEKLFEVITEGNLECVGELIEFGCDINFQVEDGITPLMMAVSSRNLELVQLLVDNDANINQIDVDGNPPLIHASSKNYWDIFEYLAPLTSLELRGLHLLTATVEGEYETVKRIIVTHVNVDFYKQKGVWSENGITALILATQEGYFEIVEALLEAGANPNFLEEDTARTPLMYAIVSKKKDIVNLLLQTCSNINSQDLTEK